jgi:transcriptional repressor OPI1
MEVERATPPPYMVRSPIDLGRPPAPPDELVALRRGQADITLPDLKTVLSHEFDEDAFTYAPNGNYASPTASVKSLPRIEPRGFSREPFGVSAPTLSSPSVKTDSVESEQSAMRTREPQSAEEIQMREAAEALAGLGGTGTERRSFLSFQMLIWDSFACGSKPFVVESSG